MFLILTLASALAADTPDELQEYRHTVMKQVGASMKASAMIVKGKVTKNNGDLVQHAIALQAAGATFESLWPDGTGPDKVAKTRSLDKIWTDKEGFAKAIDAYNKATANFVEVAKKGDATQFMAAFGQVGKSCGGCHKPYRAEEK